MGTNNRWRAVSLKTGNRIYGYLTEVMTPEGRRPAIDVCTVFGADGVSRDVEEVDPATLEQQAGMDDMYGRPIFEGDELDSTAGYIGRVVHDPDYGWLLKNGSSASRMEVVLASPTYYRRAVVRGGMEWSQKKKF